MKIIVFAAALTLASAALAQTGNTVSDPSLSRGPRGETQQGTVPDGKPCTPDGYNARAAVYPSCPIDRPPLQPCTKTVKDHCVQTYEMGVRR